MNVESIDRLKTLIASCGGSCSLGTPANAPSRDTIDQPERHLGVVLPASYKWFVGNFGGGEICGDEIFSLYGPLIEQVSGGDLVFQYVQSRRANFLNPSQVVVCRTDLGEIFFWDFDYFQENECPVFQRLPSGEIKKYSDNFVEFMILRIEACA